MYRKIKCWIIIYLCILILVGCVGRTNKNTSNINANQESVSVEESSESQIKNEQPLKESKTKYGFYPTDMSRYTNKEIVYLGMLNAASVYLNQEKLNQTWEEWNDYLVEHDSPFVMQLVTCENEELFDEIMLDQAEEELKIRFDLVSFLSYYFSASDRGNCFEPLELYFETGLKETYESVPKEYWELNQENSHVYNLFESFQFQSFGFVYEGDLDSEAEVFQMIQNEEDPVRTLDALIVYYQENQSVLQWHLPNGQRTYFRNTMVSIPFSEWETDVFFHEIAPLVGIDYLGGNDEIICLLDSPVFQKITDLYQVIYAKGAYLSGYRGAVRIGNNCVKENTVINSSLEENIYYNAGIYNSERYLCIRKDTPKLDYVLDFIRNVTTDEDYANQFYFGKDGNDLLNSLRYRFLNSKALTKRSEYYQKDYLEHLMVQAKKTPLTGFVLDTTNIKEEIDAIQMYLLSSEAFQHIENVDEWKTFDEDMKQFRRDIYDLGMQKIIDEANTQYKAWRENR